MTIAIVKQPLPVGSQQRPVAFRAWHVPSATMWNVSMFNDRHVYRTCDDDKLLNRDECILMQHTRQLALLMNKVTYYRLINT